MMRRLAVVALIGVMGAGVWGLYVVQRPYSGYSGEKIIEIPRGMSSGEIASRLASEGLIAGRWQFWIMRLIRPGAKLQAGEYRFAGPASAREVYDRIARGDVFYYELRVPEGSNIFEIARAVEALGVMAAPEFVEAASDPEMIRDLAPLAPTLEGYLFPSTYRITRQTTAHQLCRLMTDQFRRVWRQLAAAADVHETVTLASLVEKETAVATERPLVASVFANRLDRGMKLDCDPTTIYAALLEGRYDGVIHQSDLGSRNRYNTYAHAGLPPGPIANPGLESLRAVLEPASTDYLFFVAKPGGAGAHQFSTTHTDHERAVGRYRRGIKNDKKKPASGVAGRKQPGRG